MKAFASIRRRTAKFFREREDALFFVLCGVVGVVGSLVGAAFRKASELVREVFLGGSDILTAMQGLPAWQRVAVPALGALLAGLILWILRSEPGASQGVPDVMEVVLLGRRRARVRSVLVRSLASFTGLVTGSSIGREGPLIALGTSCAARVGMSFNLSEESYRILTAAGVAAGVAASYHTPLAATLFVVEIIIGVLNMRVLGAAVIAAFAASATSDAVFGIEPPQYAIPSFQVASVAEYPAYAVVGVACGAVAVLFMTSLRGIGFVFSHLSALPVYVRMMIGGALVGVIGMRVPEVYGNGYETSRELLTDAAAFGVEALILMCGAKIVATSLSIGSAMPGGVFTPTLFIGGAFGALCGQGMAYLAPESVTPGSYALIGMGAALAGTTHAPLLSTVLVVELTNNHGMILPLLLATLCSWGMSRFLKRESIYGEELKRKGVATEGSFESRVMHSLKVRDLTRIDVELVPQSMTLSEIAQKFSESRSIYLYVGDPAGKLVGAIDLHDVKSALVNPEAGGLVIAQDLANDVPVAFPEESIVDVNQRLWLQDVGHLPVVKSEQDRSYLGILTRRDVLGAVDREILKRNIHFAPMRAYGKDEIDYFELPPGGRMEAVRVPPALVGLTISGSELGKKFNVTIVAIKRRDAQGEEVRYLPQADLKLESGDTLIVLGTDAAVQKMMSGDLA